jgi:hypothetical protein
MDFVFFLEGNMLKYVNYVEEGIQSFWELLCLNAIVLKSQVNDNRALKTKCQSKPIVELPKLVSIKCTKEKCDDESRN